MEPAASPILVTSWVDPTCPWAWQTTRWLTGLEDRGIVRLTWRVFSLEANAAEPSTPFAEALGRAGPALASLILARETAGEPAFRALAQALGRSLHDERRELTPGLLEEASAEAGLADLLEPSDGDGAISERVRQEHEDARSLDVFGVPTIRLDAGRTIYGPIFALAPEGEDALAMWQHVRWLTERPDFFELKRWPRGIRPGENPLGRGTA